MNTKNNKRRRESQEKTERAFVELLQSREIKEITVSDICKITGLNRSTFYANYIDIYDLAERVKERLEKDFSEEFADYDYYNERTGALKMFKHIKENQIFYKTYFKLCYDSAHQVSVYDVKRAELELGNKNIKYHIEFFRNGLNAIIKMWLASGCEESPEEMAEILSQEYKGR
ncbi:MAG: TetR/AcrR family transcriptional regulator C-terminal domain-containing protein [Oscillospiraceae bacterium]|nr:TetR/AcrR family transcriptional regulator C-terminal domain-containing protein [Oscillospiraceae bacterium]